MVATRSVPLFLGFVLGGVLLGGQVLGCQNGPACVIDTDCPVGQRCGGDGTCRTVGERIDAGGSSDTGPPRDAPTSDVRTDAPPAVDAPATPDAPVTCPLLAAGTRAFMTLGVGCPALANITLTDDGTCTFAVMLDSTAAGTVTTGATQDVLEGTLMIGASTDECTITVDGTGGLDIRCRMGCNLTAGPPA